MRPIGRASCRKSNDKDRNTKMNRNERFSRRGGFMPPYRSCGACRNQAAPSPQGSCGIPETLAMAYIKDQPFGEVYSMGDALCRGTLFPDLDKPYCTGGRKR